MSEQIWEGFWAIDIGYTTLVGRLKDNDLVDKTWTIQVKFNDIHIEITADRKKFFRPPNSLKEWRFLND